MTASQNGGVVGDCDDPMQPECVRRCSVEYRDLCDVFRVPPRRDDGGGGRDFQRQFCDIYAARLAEARDNLEAEARRRWGSQVPVRGVHQLDDGDSARGQSIVIGTLFKRQKLKPSILKEISDEHNLQPQPRRQCFADDSDHLVLEDNMARVRLEGAADPHQFVTGVVCAVLGTTTDQGRLCVSDLCFRCLPTPKSSVSPCKSEQHSRPPHLLLVSGLEVCSDTADPAMTQLLCDLVSGQLGGPQLQQQMALVSRVLVAGNCVSAGSKDRDIMTRAAYLSRTEHVTRAAEAVRHVDHVLCQLAATCHVHVLPGEFDPCQHMWPQQPLHSCLLPRARRHCNMHAVTNPFQAEIGGRLVVGSSGQNVDDVRRFSRIGQNAGQQDDDASAAAAVLRQLLEWTHLSPTAPDTLACAPLHGRDPFLMVTCPDVLFAGNQPAYSSQLVQVPVAAGGEEASKAVRLVCVPSFRRSGSVVLLNLVTLDTQLLTIASHLVVPDAVH